MDLTVARDTVRMSGLTFDSAADHPVDCDIVLPDYCPDIARILRTEAGASVDSKTIENGRLTVTGTFSVKVIYIPDNSRNVRSVPYETAFSHVFDLKDPGNPTYVRPRARVVFVNCRPVGPRRLQVRASLAVSAKVWSDREENFISGCEDERVETLRKPLHASGYIGSTERQFDVSEELEIGGGKPAASSIIKCGAVAVMQDCKMIHNKIIAKGEVLLKTLYACDATDDAAGKLEVVEHSVPISQILDLEGVEEDCGCDADFTAGFVRVEVKPDGNGDNRILEVQLPVTASARVYRTQEFYAVTDAYSPSYELQLQTKAMDIGHVVDRMKVSDMVKQSVELKDVSIQSVTDCSVTAAVSEAKFDGGALAVSGDMNISIMAVDDTGGPACIDRTMPFTLREEVRGGEGEMGSDPEVKVLSVAGSLAGTDRIELRVECEVNALIVGNSRENAVVDMSLDDSAPKEAAPSRTLTLYYADQGENVWDIAKRYNTSMEAIKHENGLDCDTLEDRSMLLIPKKRRPRT